MPAEQRNAVLAEFKRSGLSGAQFAKLSGVKYSTLMAWVGRQRRGQAGRAKGRRPVFVQAVVARRPEAAAVLVDLGHGMTMKVSASTGVTLAAQLIHALKGPC